MSYIIDRLFDIINDTSDKDFREISMSSFSVKIDNGLVYYQDHRDIPQIITHTRTSHCVIINSLIPSYKTSTKSRIIRNDDYRTYSDKARRNYQELINSKSQDDLNQFMNFTIRPNYKKMNAPHKKWSNFFIFQINFYIFHTV